MIVVNTIALLVLSSILIASFLDNNVSKKEFICGQIGWLFILGNLIVTSKGVIWENNKK